LVATPRFRAIADNFGITAQEQLTNGFHVHVEVSSDEEAVIVLDGIRIWLPILLALSANSPFWNGRDTGFASYRSQVWSRWPTSGPTEVFRSVDSYLRYRRSVLDTGVPLDPGMLYFDARLCEHQPTVEVRVADVCLDPWDAAGIASLVRALVETVVREHESPPEVPASVLRAWMWQASQSGVDGELISPLTGTSVPAETAVGLLLQKVQPVLAEYGEDEAIKSILSEILRRGSGARWQRELYSQRHLIGDVVAGAMHAGTRASQPPVG